MRRMYSEQELTNVIKKVFEEELESGALDELVSDAVDAYLVEHPVDITALEGKDLECKSMTCTDGLTAPNVKPIYYHPILITEEGAQTIIGLSILNNSPTPITSLSALLEEIRSWNLPAARINLDGGVTINGSYYNAAYWTVFQNSDAFNLNKATDGTFFGSFTSADFSENVTIIDGVNKIN